MKRIGDTWPVNPVCGSGRREGRVRDAVTDVHEQWRVPSTNSLRPPDGPCRRSAPGPEQSGDRRVSGRCRRRSPSESPRMHREARGHRRVCGSNVRPAHSPGVYAESVGTSVPSRLQPEASEGTALDTSDTRERPRLVAVASTGTVPQGVDPQSSVTGRHRRRESGETVR